MSIVALGAQIDYLNQESIHSGTGMGAVLDGASEAAGCVFKAPVTGSLTAIKFGVQATVTAGANPVDVRLENVGVTDGLPDGTLVAANTNAAHTQNTANDKVIITATLTAAAAVTAGDNLGIRVVNPATSFGNMTLYSPNTMIVVGHPYSILEVPTRAVSTRHASFAVVIDGVTYPVNPGFPFVDTATQNAISSGLNQMGNRFKLAIQKRCIGIGFRHFTTYAGNWKFHLYDGSDTDLITSPTFDKDMKSGAGAAPFRHTFPPGVTLAAGTLYRVVAEATEASNVQMAYREVQANADLAFVDGGIEYYMTTKTGAGAWADTTTRVMDIWPIFDGVETGGGGGLRLAGHGGLAA
jgi:hypothetical protein